MASTSKVSVLRATILGVGMVVVLGCVATVVDRKTAPSMVWGPMVQMPAPPSLTVVWEMQSFWGQGSLRVHAANGAKRVYPAEKAGRRYGVVLSDLPAGESFTYELVDRGMFFQERRLAGPFSSTMPPADGASFRFIAFGDSGNGSNTQADLAALLAKHKPAVVIHAGDLVYPAGSPEDYLTNFFEPNAVLIAAAPFMASLGNHDVATDHGRPLLDTFVLPENGPAGIEAERNYWFDFGCARFVALDSNPTEQDGVLTQSQRENVVAPWAREVLSQAQGRWKFVFFHHPFYTNSTHPAEGSVHMKRAFVRVFEETGVDVVFCGHNHLYERMAPMREDKVVPVGQGVVYITTGAGGVSRYPEKQPVPPYVLAYNDKVFSFTVVDLSPGRFALEQIDENDQVIDEFVIEKRTMAGR